MKFEIVNTCIIQEASVSVTDLTAQGKTLPLQEEEILSK